MARTKVERLLAASDEAIDVDSSEFDGWGDPSTIFTERLTFARTGSANSKMHIAVYESPYGGNLALCGVGVGATGPQTLNTLIERDLCPKCLRTLEKEGD